MESIENWTESESLDDSDKASGILPVEEEPGSRALRLVVRLGQPFDAFLLAQQRIGEYKRIASDYNIIAQVKDIASVDNMDVGTCIERLHIIQDELPTINRSVRESIVNETICNRPEILFGGIAFVGFGDFQWQAGPIVSGAGKTGTLKSSTLHMGDLWFTAFPLITRISVAFHPNRSLLCDLRMQLHLTAMRETLPELLKKMKEVAQSAGLEKVVMWDFPRDISKPLCTVQRCTALYSVQALQLGPN
ncbi:hypothetical protein C8R48DRAFT_678697 [Suillus tomentosus]|nr:hypothetical protein C8R48DRAFT_678697 [Suillus tomentosus]